MLLGVAMVGAGLGLAPLVQAPWHLCLTLGVLVGGGTVCLGYTGHALFPPNWFVRRCGLYVLAFWIAIGASAVSAFAMCLAAARKVRAVAGRVPRAG